MLGFFEEDARARKRLAELLVGEPDIRLAIINTVLRDVATKEDIERLHEEMQDLREQVARIEGRLDMLVKTSIAFNLPLLLAVIGILFKMIIQP